MLNDINILAFNFIERLSSIEKNYDSQEINNSNLRGDGTEMIADLGEVQNIGIDSFNPIDGKISEKYKSIGGELVGLRKDSFKDFSELIIEVSELPEFQGKSDFDFLVKNGFDWLMDVYVNKRAQQEMTDYLLDKIVEETKEYTFYYKIDGIAIENEFCIGNSRIVFISDSQIEAFCCQVLQEPEMDLLNVKKSYQDTLKGVNIKVAVKSTSMYAQHLALREAELAMDVLKCFVVGYSINKFHAVPDLNHRKTNFKSLFYWVFTDNAVPKNPNFQNFDRFIALPIDNNFIANAKKYGLEIFSNFIKKRHHDELYKEIIDAIQRFAQIASTISNYEKVVKAISLIEGCILSRPGKGSGDGERKIKKRVLPKLTISQLDIFEKAIRKAYAIRNAFVHNGQELPLDEENMWVLLEIIRLFIIKLINLHQSGKRVFEDIERYFN